MLAKEVNTFIVRSTGGKGVDLSKVAKDLGVHWIVEGSLMRSAEDLRVTVQLIETKNFNHTYSKKFGFKLKDMFDVQDEITQKITSAIDVKIMDHTMESSLKKKDFSNRYDQSEL